MTLMTPMTLTTLINYDCDDSEESVDDFNRLTILTTLTNPLDFFFGKNRSNTSMSVLRTVKPESLVFKKSHNSFFLQ